MILPIILLAIAFGVVATEIFVIAEEVKTWR